MTRRKRQYDLAVIGAGAYGSAIAYEAATRGLSVFLAEKGDFGAATSANSLKIVHGGLRYLQKLDLIRARGSTRERSMFLRNAPGLVEPLRCVLPTGWSLNYNRLFLGAGLALNGLITIDRNSRVSAERRLPGSRILSRPELASYARGLHMHDVTGGACWHDAVMVDSERLSLAFVLGARESGATVGNYLSAREVLSHGGRAAGLAVRDELSGREEEITAKAVVSCQGPWGLAKDTSVLACPDALGRVKAVNLVLPATELAAAVGFPARDHEGRPVADRLLFAVPWQGVTMVGTWYFESDDSPDDLHVTPSQLSMMLEELNSGFENWSFTARDVRMLHIGELPRSHLQPQPAPVSRPLVAEASRFGGLRGAWVVQGEKWTTARATAREVTESISRQCGLRLEKSVSLTRSLERGAEAGTAMPSVIYDAGDEIGPEHEAAIVHSLREEMVRTLPDLVLRRTNLGATGRPSPALLNSLASIAARELNWSEAEKALNVTAMERHRMYPDAAGLTVDPGLKQSGTERT